MYQVAICEDEPQAAQENEALVCQILERQGLRRGVEFTVTKFTAPADLLALLKKKPALFHLLLLDIELGGQSGIALAACLRANAVRSSIIYITAYRDYVFDCFESRPLQYLVKPVDAEKLAAAISWDLRENYRPERLRLPAGEGWRDIAVHSILYAEAANHKSLVHLQEEVLPIRRSFSDLLPLLSGGPFCRCHYSIVVNLGHIYRLTPGGLVLDNGRQLPVSRSRQKELKMRFISFMERP